MIPFYIPEFSNSILLLRTYRRSTKNETDLTGYIAKTYMSSIYIAFITKNFPIQNVNFFFLNDRCLSIEFRRYLYCENEIYFVLTNYEKKVAREYIIFFYLIYCN